MVVGSTGLWFVWAAGLASRGEELGDMHMVVSATMPFQLLLGMQSQQQHQPADEQHTCPSTRTTSTGGGGGWGDSEWFLLLCLLLHTANHYPWVVLLLLLPLNAAGVCRGLFHASRQGMQHKAAELVGCLMCHGLEALDLEGLLQKKRCVCRVGREVLCAGWNYWSA